MNKIISGFVLIFMGIAMCSCGAIDEPSLSPQNDNKSYNVGTNDISHDAVDKIEDDYRITAVPEVPDELKEKNIIYNQTELEYDQIMNLENICNSYIDTLVTVRINGFDYTWLKNASGGGSSWTIIDATVTDNLNSELEKGKNIKIYTYGGYTSMRERLSDILYETGGKYGDGLDMTEGEIDNTVYCEIVDGGELPIINQEYAMCLKRARENMLNGDYELIGGVKGILLKTDENYMYRSLECDENSDSIIEKYSRDDLINLFHQ